MSNHLKVTADREAKEKKDKKELFDKILCALLVNSAEDLDIVINYALEATNLAYEVKKKMQ